MEQRNRRACSGPIEIEYDVFGDSGEPLVLVMGISAQRLNWRVAMCEAFVQMGFQVVRFDHRDLGGSTWLHGAPVPQVLPTLGKALLKLPIEAPYTLSDMADDVTRIMDDMGWPSAHVFGVSMGGMVAQTLAIDHPDRVRSLTSMMSSPGSRRHTLGSPSAVKALIGSGLPANREQYIDFRQAFFVAVGGDIPLDLDVIRAIGGECWDKGYNPVAFRRHFAAVSASGSRLGALARLHTPTAVIHGDKDPLIPLRAGVATAEAIPGATLKVISGLGHAMPMSVWPQIFAEVQAVAARA